jgi:hypothetical protein
MKLQDDDYNKKERNPNVMELVVELEKKDLYVVVLGSQELVRKLCLVVIGQRLTHQKKRSVEVREKRWTLRRWRMMIE